MPETRKTILLFSLEPWGGMWYSKQHYAWELAKEHEVFFISPPDRWRFRDLFGAKPRLEPVTPGLTLVHYRNPLPLRVLPKSLASRVRKRAAEELTGLLAPMNNLLWCFYPEPLALQPALHNKAAPLIYHVVDPYQTFLGDIPMAKAADLIVAINPDYRKHYLQWNDRVIVVPHGISRADRSYDPVAKAAHVQQWGPYVILAGGLNRHVNYALLNALADRLAKLELVLVGKLSEERLEGRDELLSRSNVTHIGAVSPSALKSLVAGASAGLIAYDFESRSKCNPHLGRTPLKTITYLAQSKPVISTINCHIPSLSGKAIHQVADEPGFINTVQQAIEGKLPFDATSVNGYLDHIEYPGLIGKILKAVPATTPIA